MYAGFPSTGGINEHLGRRLRQRRRMLGLTLRELAQADGLQFQQIQKYECGASAMSAERLWRLARLLDAPVAYFYQGLGAGTVRPISADTADGLEMAEFLRVCAGLSQRARHNLLALMQSMTGEEQIAAATHGEIRTGVTARSAAREAPSRPHPDVRSLGRGDHAFPQTGP